MRKQILILCLIMSLFIYSCSPNLGDDDSNLGNSETTVENGDFYLSSYQCNISIGSTYQIDAKVSNDSTPLTNVVWTIDDESVATVSSSGLITAIKSGTATVSVSYEDGTNSLTCEVTVSLNWAGYSVPGSKSGQCWSCIASSADGAKCIAGVNGGYLYASSDGGDTWSTTGEYSNWRCITCSSDGSVFFAGNFSGYIYKSTDLGTTWTECYYNSSIDWLSITSSSDGKYVAAVDFDINSCIYTSTDGGDNWNENDDTNKGFWKSVTSSSDGSKIVAVSCASTGYIYISTDYGSTWTYSSDNIDDLKCITSSSDGTKLAAVEDDGYIYTSNDSGITWTAKTSEKQSWTSITSSSDGTKLVAVEDDGYIYTSNDSGETWTAVTNEKMYWTSIASSSDGSKLVAVRNYNYIYTSSDSGETWSTHDDVGTKEWASVTASNDGSIIYAGLKYGNIFKSTDKGESWTQLTDSGVHYWYSITTSDDGIKVAAVDHIGGYVYTSDDSGVSWTKQEGLGLLQNVKAIASSSDGNVIVTGDGYEGYIYLSSDGGNNWTAQTTPGEHNWLDFSISADGTVIYAIPNSGGLYGTTDSGTSWNSLDVDAGVTVIGGWHALSCTSDGKTIVISTYNASRSFLSSDYGATSLEITCRGSNIINCSIASDSSFIVGIDDDSSGFVYISSNNGNTWLKQGVLPYLKYKDVEFSNDGTTIIIVASDDEKVYIAETK